LVALFFLMSRGTSAELVGPDLSSSGSPKNIIYKYQESKEDPLAKKYSAKKTTFVSKKTGKISPGMYSRPVVRRKGVLKHVIKRVHGGTERYMV